MNTNDILFIFYFMFGLFRAGEGAASPEPAFFVYTKLKRPTKISLFHGFIFTLQALLPKNKGDVPLSIINGLKKPYLS